MDHHAQHAIDPTVPESTPRHEDRSDGIPTFLIVDDHALVRYGLSLALRQRYAEARILEAGSLADALRRLSSNADLTAILYDLQMSDSDGAAGLQVMLEAAGEVPVVVVSGVDDTNVIAGCIRAGARGFVPKGCEGVVLDQALPIVLAGGIFAPAPPAPRGGRPIRIPLAATAPATRGMSAAPSGGAMITDLTDRQREVLRLLLKGCSNKEIARSLGVLEGTIKVHLRTVMQRLGVRNRTQLALAAVRAGVTTTT